MHPVPASVALASVQALAPDQASLSAAAGLMKPPAPVPEWVEEWLSRRKKRGVGAVPGGPPTPTGTKDIVAALVVAPVDPAEEAKRAAAAAKVSERRRGDREAAVLAGLEELSIVGSAMCSARAWAPSPPVPPSVAVGSRRDWSTPRRPRWRWRSTSYRANSSASPSPSARRGSSESSAGSPCLPAPTDGRPSFQPRCAKTFAGSSAGPQPAIHCSKRRTPSASPTLGRLSQRARSSRRRSTTIHRRRRSGR